MIAYAYMENRARSSVPDRTIQVYFAYRPLLKTYYSSILVNLQSAVKQIKFLMLINLTEELIAIAICVFQINKQKRPNHPNWAFGLYNDCHTVHSHPPFKMGGACYDLIVSSGFS